MFYPKEKSIPKQLLALFLLSTLWLTACGELEFGVETKVSSGRPEVTVVTTTVAEIPEGMALVTVTPSATAVDTMTATPTAVATQTPAATETAVATETPTRVQIPATTAPILPTATPIPQQAAIISYTPIIEIYYPGDSLTLNYEAQGESVSLCLAPAFTALWECRTVPLSGPYTFTLDPTYHTNLNLELRVTAGETRRILGDYIGLYCSEDDWFFSGPPTTCPADAPIETAAAFEPFEHGWMLWLEEDNIIYTFYEQPNQTFATYSESALPGSDTPLPSDEYDPPEGLFVPVSGFGLLWREYSWVRQSLGWALAPEEGFTTTIQHEYQENANYLYLLAPDDQLIVLNLFNGTWAERSQP